MPLIQLEDGRKLNSENVILFRPQKSGAYEFCLSGNVTISGFVDDPEMAFFPIVPAAVGFRTVEKDIVNGERIYTFKPVVAWRLCPGGNYPLAAGGNYSEEDGYAAIECPSGEIIDVDGNRFESVEEFKAMVAEEDEDRNSKAA
ncbi:hypothetical protein [Mesorhizobium sp. 8]|uniref:hypothetical protein n=1 Tax=Mesorhizobium sp. 8 TaxID=2584466 RepID=UPI00111E78AB|nr:hypothetical protein [Mesorhizobium sp. 8]QDC00355.1 hypothetical protein FGU64_07965 [Mesorhizobium sp. 8]